MNPVLPIRSLRVPCRFDGMSGHVQMHIGEPTEGLGAVHFQRHWLRETRGGELDQDVLDALDALARRSGLTPGS